MTQPLSLSGIGRQAPADLKIKIARKFPASIAEGRYLEDLADQGQNFSVQAKEKLSNFIEARGIWRAIKGNENLRSGLNEKQLTLLELYQDLVDRAQRQR